MVMVAILIMMFIRVVVVMRPMVVMLVMVVIVVMAVMMERTMVMVVMMAKMMVVMVLMVMMVMVMVVKVFMRSILGLATLPGGGTGWQGAGGADANKVFIATFDIEANPPFIQFTFQALILFPSKFAKLFQPRQIKIFLLTLSVLTVLYILVSSSFVVSGFKSSMPNFQLY